MEMLEAMVKYEFKTYYTYSINLPITPTDQLSVTITKSSVPAAIYPSRRTSENRYDVLEKAKNRFYELKEKRLARLNSPTYFFFIPIRNKVLKKALFHLLSYTLILVYSLMYPARIRQNVKRISENKAKAIQRLHHNKLMIQKFMVNFEDIPIVDIEEEINVLDAQYTDLKVGDEVYELNLNFCWNPKENFYHFKDWNKIVQTGIIKEITISFDERASLSYEETRTLSIEFEDHVEIVSICFDVYPNGYLVNTNSSTLYLWDKNTVIDILRKIKCNLGQHIKTS